LARATHFIQKRVNRLLKPEDPEDLIDRVLSLLALSSQGLPPSRPLHVVTVSRTAADVKVQSEAEPVGRRHTELPLS
jgi:hypothetical protein